MPGSLRVRRWGWGVAVLGLALALARAMPAGAAGNGKVLCEVLENGKPASGTLTVLEGDSEIASGSCGKPFDVPAGTYTAALSLDGALDGPEQKKPLSVSAGQSTKIDADFATGLLEMRIRSQGKDAAGMAVIRKDNKQIGTLGSGVAAHLSVGSYQVVARYRSQEKRFDTVEIKKGERTPLEAAFE
jgi:hypothetical protein